MLHIFHHIKNNNNQHTHNLCSPYYIYLKILFDIPPLLDTSTNDIRLEDFFLNSSGDEPLILSLKSNARLTTSGFTGRETFIKTATVIATVYVGEDSVGLSEGRVYSLIRKSVLRYLCMFVRTRTTQMKLF